jgi:hypothetical protein
MYSGLCFRLSLISLATFLGVQYLKESQKIVYMVHLCYIPMKHQFHSMNDQFNGYTEKRRPPPHLTCHEVYEMVKDVHIVLGNRNGLARILKRMTCGRSNRFFGSYRITKT